MDDQTSDNSFESLQNDNSAYSQPIRYHRPHISQEPINDAEPEYVTRNRYQTLEESQSARRHMGVAPTKQHRRGPRPKQTLTHSARYLETPKQGKSIFTSSNRRRRQHRLQIALLIIAIVAIALVIHFVFFK